MTTPEKRKLHSDQQRPSEELPDARDGHVLQGMFSRKAPTQEDEYFSERERHPHVVIGTPKLSSRRLRRINAGAGNDDDQAPNIWQRIFRKLLRGDDDWRP